MLDTPLSLSLSTIKFLGLLKFSIEKEKTLELEELSR